MSDAIEIAALLTANSTCAGVLVMPSDVGATPEIKDYFALVDAVVPFVGSYRPFWLGLGAVAFDLVIRGATVVTQARS